MDSEPPTGLLIVDKPAGWTSHQVVGRIRRLLGTRRVGHAGTLDPMATGVLIVGVGRATRLLGHLMAREKEYLATIRLGARSDTDDADGTVEMVHGTDHLSASSIGEALAEFRGEVTQVPSAVSAIKVAGVRSYALARRGEAPELAARPVRIDVLEMLEHRRVVTAEATVTDVDVRVVCGPGTYIRAIARDLGQQLGVGGHLVALRRSRIGPFTEAEAIDIATAGEGERLSLLDAGSVAAQIFPSHTATDREATAVGYGQALTELRLDADPTAILASDGRLLALYRPGPDGAVPVAVFVG